MSLRQLLNDASQTREADYRNMSLEPLFDIVDRLTEATQKVRTSIENLQDLCNHEFVYHGNNGRYDYEKCVKCRLMRKI